jgi:hypothetical protein
LSRYAKRVDANQGDISKAFRDMGCQVLVIGDPVDLLVNISGQNWMVEVKDGSKPKSAQKKTPKQERFFSEWGGAKALVSDVAGVITLVNGVRLAKA